MHDIINLPGLHFVGYVSNNHVNQGEPVAVFEPVVHKDLPSINTLEGWNAAANKQNRKSFVFDHGREPESDNELEAWIQKVITV